MESGSGFFTVNEADLIQLLAGDITRSIHVCDIEPELAAAINAITTTVLLSPDTVKKQRLCHPELNLEHYRLIPEIIQYGLVLRDSPQSITFYEDDRPHFGNLWQVSVKVTQDRNELYMSTFHPLEVKQILKAHRKGTLLRYRVNDVDRENKKTGP